MPLGVILATYGEPTRNSFAEQWMYSYRILKRLTVKIAKIPAPVIPIISTARGVQRVRAWSENDFISDLEPLTDKTVTALRSALEERGLATPDIVVARMYEFRRPLLTDILPGLREQGCDKFIVIPLYMGSGDFTHGMTQIAIDITLSETSWLKPEDIGMCFISGTPERDQKLADVAVNFFRKQVKERGIDLPAKDWAVCLAAHGSVQTPMDGVDNGVDGFGSILWRIYKQLRGDFGMARNGWLNHTRGGRWTEPSVEALLPRLRAAGYEKLVYYPWGFTTDNAESALEGRLFLDEMEDPFPTVEYLPCLNDDAGFIGLLADRVEEAMSSELAQSAEKAEAAS